jgi:hypothetical protein
MDYRPTLGQKVLDWLGILNSICLFAITSPAAFLFSDSRIGFAVMMCLTLLLVGAIQASLAAASYVRQRTIEIQMQAVDTLAWPNRLRRSVHGFAIFAWLFALSDFYISPRLPTTANKIRRRDSHFLVQNFAQHRQDIEKLRLDLLQTKNRSSQQNAIGSEFHWDGGSEIYKDGRIDIEIFQEPQGLNGQIFVGYAKRGKMPIDFEWDGLNDGTAGEVVKDIEKDQSKQWKEYQALGEGWYIYYWSS